MAKSDTTTPKRKPVWKLTRRGVYGGIALALVACTWTFFLGVLVGRGTAPVHFDIEKLGHDLQALREQVQQHKARELEAYSAAVENKSDLDFYEDLKQPGDTPETGLDLTRSSLAPATMPDIAEAAPPAEEDTAPAASDIPVKKPLPGLQPKKNAAVQPPRKPKPAEQEVPPSPGSLTLQVASLRDAAMADAMAARLRKEGYSVSRAGVTIPGKGTWYRVQVGHFADREAAAATMRALKAMGLKPIIVSR